MSKSRRASRKPIYIIITLSLTLAIGYSLWNTYLRPEPVKVMVVGQENLAYGEVSLFGSIRKESLSNGKLNYVLITDTGRALPLNVTGIDTLIGFKVKVTGLYLPLDSETGIRDVIKVSVIGLQE